MSGSPAQVRLVSNAMGNSVRRKIMALLQEGPRKRDEIAQAVGPRGLEYHLQILQQADLALLKDDLVELSEFGRTFMGSREVVERKVDLKGTKTVEIAEVRQLIPCIADPSRFRIIARLHPPLGGALEHLEAVFPRARYSPRIGALIVRRKDVLITLYASGNVTMTMIRGEEEARDLLEELRRRINEAIENGITPIPRERSSVDPLDVNKYLPHTDCKSCGEQSCYAFAIRLVAGERSLDLCAPLEEDKYSINLEHLKSLMESV